MLFRSYATGQLKNLIIHSLVQIVADQDAKQSTKIQAAKVLGTVAGVDAFVHRSEHKIIKSSDDAKTTLLAKLREVMNQGATDAEIKSADSLIAELLPSDPAVAEIVQEAEVTPAPTDGVWSPSLTMHTNVHTQSQKKSDPPLTQNSAESLEEELGRSPLGDSKRKG